VFEIILETQMQILGQHDIVQISSFLISKHYQNLKNMLCSEVECCMVWSGAAHNHCFTKYFLPNTAD